MVQETTHITQYVHVCTYVGREARTYGLGLDEAKVAVDPKSGKIIVDSEDATTAGHIFAIGDAIDVSESTCIVFLTSGRMHPN